MKQGLIFAFLFTLLAGCTSSTYEQLRSNNSNFRVKSIIMHYTAIDYAASVRALVDKDGLSSHYLLPESNDPSYPYDELKILQLVDENERAWHAGVSYWQGRTGLNDTSIGIEIVNVPKCEHKQDALLKPEHGKNRLCVFPDFDPKQISLLIELTKGILERNPDIEPTAVIAHSDIAPSRKNDPGPRFPWFQLYEEGIGAWYDQQTLASYWQQFSDKPITIGLLQEAFHAYGYGITQTGVMDQQTIDVISAFQMHFLPWQVNGRNDSSTSAAIFALIEKYFPAKLDNLLFRYENEHAQPKPPVFVANGQIDRWFSPDQNKTSFFTYANTGEITISATTPTRADVYINGAKLNLKDSFTQEPATYSISKRTRHGLNSLTVDNFDDDDASVFIQVNYPTISYGDSNSSASIFASADAFITSLIGQTQGEQTQASLTQRHAELFVLQKGNVLSQNSFGSKQENSSHPYTLGSSSHVLSTTLSVMHLVAQGKIQLTKPVYTYLPNYRGQGRDLITVQDLLMHTSGYETHLADYLGFEPQEIAQMMRDKAFINDLVLNRIPAAKSDISSPSEINHILLAYIIERVSNTSVKEYVETHIYRPLGLDAQIYSNHADNGESVVNKVINQQTENSSVAAKQPLLLHQVDSTANDVATVAQLLLNKGGYGFTGIFDHNTFKQFVSPNDQNNQQALGWQTNTFKYMKPDENPLFGYKSSDAAFGYIADNFVLLIDPQMDLCIVFLSNLDNVKENASELIDLIYMDLLKRF